MNKYLPVWTISPNQGGSSIWVTGPTTLDARVLAQRCLQKGVLIEPGNIHYISDDRPYNRFRLGYTSINENNIEEGIKIISQVAESITSKLNKT